jgi:thiol-disulfide isomerase/thioredoxin
VRTDPAFAERVRAWERGVNRSFVDLHRPNGVDDVSVSFSGKERNHLFLSEEGRQFYEVSSASGADSPCDARSFALIDPDRDGFPDLLVANANAPALQLFRNDIPRLGARTVKDGGTETTLPAPVSQARFVALRFRGGNLTAMKSDELGPRDGYGAVATVVVGKKTLVRELRCGEGLAAQNSSTLLVGIGAADTVDRIEVRWPRGRKTVIESVPAGSLVTLWEESSQSPDGKGVAVEPYARPGKKAQPVASAPGTRFLPEGLPRSGAGPALRVYTSMATWCPSCKKELPQIEALKAALGPGVALHGIPVDANDDAETLRRYVAANLPAYELLTSLAPGDLDAAKRLIVETLGTEALPATIVTDGEGRVLAVTGGVPTVSELKKLLGTGR